jgi:RNA polymerase sigma factor (sigma-70 family)
LTRRLCIDRLRASAREQPLEDLEGEGGEDRIEELTEAFAVHEALAQLPGHCREILDRFFARDESYRTIADALDLPSGTIASRISRCLARLRERLTEESEPDPRLEV